MHAVGVNRCTPLFATICKKCGAENSLLLKSNHPLSYFRIVVRTFCEFESKFLFGPDILRILSDWIDGIKSVSID